MRTLLTSLLGLTLAIAPAGCGGKKTESNGTGSASGAGSAVTSTGSGSAIATSSGSGSAMANGSGSATGSDATNGSGSGATTGSGSGAGSSAMGGSGDGSDTSMAHHAGNCPSTVQGSTTKDELKGGKVIVTISSSDKDAIAAIQKRADELVKEKQDNLAAGTTTSGHDQKGTHGGGMGLCPVYVPEGASASVKHDAKGVVVTITPDAKDKPEDFKMIVDGRITRAADWVKDHITPARAGNEGAVGGGKGSDGSNHSGLGDGKGIERKNGSGSDAKK